MILWMMTLVVRELPLCTIRNIPRCFGAYERRWKFHWVIVQLITYLIRVAPIHICNYGGVAMDNEITLHTEHKVFGLRSVW